jgi:tetratricopeptide (TPR) repeat protein
MSPNFALGYFALGMARIHVGNFEEAIDPLLRCQRLSPNDPLTFEFVNKVALAHYHLGNYEEALHHAQRSISSRRVFGGLLTVIACLGQLDRAAEAAPYIAEVKALPIPDVAEQWTITAPYADPAHRAQYLEGLNKAGYSF